ncbi:MAG: tRNA lysidine(34) synthetase TilS [Ruminococcaceae bacterium]|nr:tRNA lysidine(34) synthetase TilS [Oscillospiraceae bacterium]
MIPKIKDTIARHGMIPTGSCVAVGLSGGADSVSLLHALLELRDELDITLRAVHINHGIRGESALRDERFCRELCDALGVPLHCVILDVPAIAAQRCIGLEECGRQCRYEQFSLMAQEHGCIIATAHTLSDSVETVMFNLARGSALGGVCGIPPVRKLDSGSTVVRPLIGVTREDVERYCTERGLSFVTDETNADTAYRRNLIRHEVIPTLRKVNPSVHTAVERFGRCAAEDDAYLCALAAEALQKAAIEGGWSADTLAALPSPLLRRCVVAITRARGCTPEYAQLELCADAVRNGSGAVMLTERLRFAVSRGVARLDSGSASQPEQQWEVRAIFPRTRLPDGRVLVFTEIDLGTAFATQKHQKLLFKNALSCDIIKDNISVRNRREGDRFAQAGRGVTKKLKKLLCDEGIPAEQRASLALIVNEMGILWTEGFGASELCRPSPDDHRVILPEISGKE